MKVKLSAWAKQVGVSFKTAQRWYYSGKMPVPTERTPTGRIMVCLEEPAEVAIEVSDLRIQVDRLSAVVDRLESQTK